MRKTLTLAALTAGGVLAMGGTAAANVDDIEELNVNGTAAGSASALTIQGTISCDADLGYGVIVKVITGAADTTTGGDQTTEADAQGVGAFGPNFEGVQDDQPCVQADTGTGSETNFDVTVANNAEATPFTGTAGSVQLLAGTTADGRGPGPIVGDVEIVQQALTVAIN